MRASTPLPARDGVPHGNVKRSDTAPELLVLHELDEHGRPDHLGRRSRQARPLRGDRLLHLPRSGRRLDGRVVAGRMRRWRQKSPRRTIRRSMAQEHDRVPAGESYMKDFKPLTLGTLELPAGRGQLTLRALQVAGKQVMDVRYIVLTRVDEASKNNPQPAAQSCTTSR